MNKFFIAFSITFISSAFTLIGSLIGISSKKSNTKLLSLALGFSGGVMLYLSFVEIFNKGNDILIENFGKNNGIILATSFFFLGMFIVSLIDKIVPHFNEISLNSDMPCLYRMGILSAFTIGIHNIPEGISTFVSSFNSHTTGISLGFAIAIHNISVGMAIAIPIYFSSKNKKKAILYSSLSALCAPLSALIAYLFLGSYLNEIATGFIFSLISGMMIFICLDEILPSAEKYGDHHFVIYGTISGMLVMAISLIALES